MHLLKPSKKFEKSWHEAMEEFRAEKRKGFWNLQKEPFDLDEYVQTVRDHEQGRNLPETWVPATTYWLIHKGVFVGHTNIRHQLNEYLLKIGGNIGYYIRPSMRGKGYGTKILELALVEAKSLGLKKVLVTCEASNLFSKRVIEKNGGQFEDEVDSVLRYWIEL